jgi:hypothetical protein
VTAGEVGQDAAGFEEADFGALADGEVAQGLGDVGLADSDGTVQQDRLSTVEQRSAARSRIWAAGSFGLAAKSNPSRVACWSK